MRTLRLLIPLLLLPAVVDAVICKTIDADGVVGYSDVPASECADPVELPDYSRYAPRIPQASDPPASPATGTLAEPFAGYGSARIIQPEPNATVRNNEGIVPVVLVSEPPLRPGHEVEIMLDGRKVEGRFAGSSVVLNGVERGTHSVRAAILDAAGAALIETAPVRFTLRKTGLFDRPAEPEQPIAPTVPAAPRFETPPANPDLTPDGGAAYAPPPAPSGVTPGRSNPAFDPAYTP